MGTPAIFLNLKIDACFSDVKVNFLQKLGSKTHQNGVQRRGYGVRNRWK